MRKLLWVVLAGVVLLGCRKSRDEDSVKAIPPADVAVVFDQFEMEMEQGNTNAALQVLETALADEKYSHARDSLFVRTIQVFLMLDRVEDAKARIARLGMKCGTEALREALSGIHYYYLSSKNLGGLEAWTKDLLDMKLPVPLFRVAVRWHLDAIYQKGGIEVLCDRLPAIMARMEGAEFAGIIHSFAGGLVSQKRFGDVEKILELLAGKSDTVPELRRFQNVMRTELLIVQDQLEEADRALVNVAARIPDGELQRLFSMLVSRYAHSQKTEACDRLCEFILAKHPDQPESHQAAARAWIDSARKAGAISQVPVRMQKLHKFKVDTKCQTQLYMRQFYDVTAQGSEEDQAGMLAFGHELRTRVTPDIQKQLNGMFFDAAVLKEDYAAALKILDEGIGHEEAGWKEMASNKIKAHMALKEGRKEEAVQRFRQFMEQRSKMDEPVRDPVTGMIYTRDMTMGYNAMRIGDILKSMGDKKGAKDAYNDARQYYDVALNGLKAETEEYKYVQAELAKLP